MSISDTQKKRGRGRPSTGGQMLGTMVRMPPDRIAELDAWRAAQPDPKPSRPEAIRRLLAKALANFKP
jgi:hypothetical protein